MPVLCVGLGNPGDEYATTRHNAGFLFLDQWAQTLGVLNWRRDFDGLVSATQSSDLGKIILLKPQTYMNASGRSVAACLNFFKLSPKDLVVFHDDLDLPVGVFKVKKGGSHGGHNGLRDIHRALGTDTYARVRMGIDRPADRAQVKDYVLSHFSSPEMEDMQYCFRNIIEKLGQILPHES